MTQADVPEVSRVERRCFENPWPASAYRRELRNAEQNYYVVLRAQPETSADGTQGESRFGEGLRARLPLIHLPRRGMLERPRIAGFAGMWCVFDEAHVTTIGVDPFYRGRGFGDLLLISLFDEAIRRGALWVTLEVRVSNRVALALYDKFGMSVQTTRRRYYSDNGEDAYVMWSRSLRDSDYLDQLDTLRDRIMLRVGREIDVTPPVQAPFAGEALRAGG